MSEERRKVVVTAAALACLSSSSASLLHHAPRWLVWTWIPLLMVLMVRVCVLAVRLRRNEGCPLRSDG